MSTRNECLRLLALRAGRLGGEDDTTGIEVCRDIRSAHPEVSCVMLTSFADEEGDVWPLSRDFWPLRDDDSGSHYRSIPVVYPEPEVGMSQCHDIYDMIRTDTAGTVQKWLVRIDLDEIAGMVRASAVLTEDEFSAEGEGMCATDVVGTDGARQLAAGEALLEVAGTLIGGQLSAAHTETQQRRAS